MSVKRTFKQHLQVQNMLIFRPTKYLFKICSMVFVWYISQGALINIERPGKAAGSECGSHMDPIGN